MKAEKKKAIIYGLGGRFNNVYFYKFLLPEIERKYEVIGVSDKIKPKYINETRFTYITKSSDLKKADVIIVTSDIYFEEIKAELSNEVGLSNIISLESLEEELLNAKFEVNIFDSLFGVEIGGPSDIFKGLYKKVKRCDGVNYSSDTVWWKDKGRGYLYKGRVLGDTIIADAIDLSKIKDNTYDFCISSNNLEHIANPMKAIKESIRILKNDGIIFVVVPKKEDCFDHNRNVTSFEHLLNDYNSNISEQDLSHLEEILKYHDFEMDTGIETVNEFMDRAKGNYYNRCLHHHVFDDILMCKIFDFFKISIIKSGSIFGNYFIIGRVSK